MNLLLRCDLQAPTQNWNLGMHFLEVLDYLSSHWQRLTFTRIKFYWNCCIYCITQWEKLILISECYKNHCENWFARIKFHWNCCIYCMTQWEKLILISGCYLNHCENWIKSNFTETDAFTVWLNERNWFLYLNVTRITARINSVILSDSHRK